MKVFERSSLMKIHALLAAFIFPVAAMFFITGALYTWGVKGSYDTSTYTLALEQALQPQLYELRELAATELQLRNLEPPTGKAKLKEMGTSFSLEWTGSNRDVIIQPTEQALVAQLQIKETSWYRKFVQLHKAKGGELFKVYAAILAASLMLLLASGFVMAWKTPRLQKLSLIASVLGVAVFILMAASS